MRVAFLFQARGSRFLNTFLKQSISFLNIFIFYRYLVVSKNLCLAMNLQHLWCGKTLFFEMN